MHAGLKPALYDIGLRVVPIKEGRAVFLELVAGAEVGLGRPRLGYSDAGVFVPSGALWPVQPTLGLSLL